jgi:hypothetical protein
MVRSSIDDLKPDPEASFQRRLTPTPHFQDPCDRIHHFPSMFLLLLPQFSFKFQMVPFVTMITTKIPVKALLPSGVCFL